MTVSIVNSIFCFVIFCIFVLWGARRKRDGKGTGWQKGIAIFFGLMTMFGISNACSAGGYDLGALLIFILGWFVILIVSPLINNLASGMNSNSQTEKSDSVLSVEETINTVKTEDHPAFIRHDQIQSAINNAPMQAIPENSSNRINRIDMKLSSQMNTSRGNRSNNTLVYLSLALITGLLAWAVYSHSYLINYIDDVAYNAWKIEREANDIRRDLEDKHDDAIRRVNKEISQLTDKYKSLEDEIGWVKSDQKRLESSLEDGEEPPVVRKPLLGTSPTPRQTNNTAYYPPLPPLSPDDDINVELEECNKAEIAMVSDLMSRFLYANEKGDEAMLMGIYADTVSYCYNKHEKTSKEYIMSELKELWRKWPVRSYRIIDAKFQKRRTDKYYITANAVFNYKNGNRSISGDVEYWIFFQYIPGKGFRMTLFDETVKMHKRK